MFAIDSTCGRTYGIFEGGSRRFYTADYFGEFSGNIFRSEESKMVARHRSDPKPKYPMISGYH